MMNVFAMDVSLFMRAFYARWNHQAQECARWVEHQNIKKKIFKKQKCLSNFRASPHSVGALINSNNELVAIINFAIPYEFLEIKKRLFSFILEANLLWIFLIFLSIFSCGHGIPEGHAKLSHHHDWIEAKMKSG